MITHPLLNDVHVRRDVLVSKCHILLMQMLNIYFRWMSLHWMCRLLDMWSHRHNNSNVNDIDIGCSKYNCRYLQLPLSTIADTIAVIYNYNGSVPVLFDISGKTFSKKHFFEQKRNIFIFIIPFSYIYYENFLKKISNTDLLIDIPINSNLNDISSIIE